MPRLKRQTQHCKDLAKKRKLEIEKSYDISDNILCSDDGDSTEDEIEWIDDQIENEAEHLFSVLMENMKTLNLSKRPLTYLKNSRTTKYRKKIEALENRKKNGQTLHQLLSGSSGGSGGDSVSNSGGGFGASSGGSSGGGSGGGSSSGLGGNSNINSIKNKPIKNIQALIDTIGNKLKFENEHLTPGHQIRLKAIQHYLQLLNKGHTKLNASQVVADLFNRGKWFARCVRSWVKSFIIYGDIPQSNRGKHFKGSSILNDEDIQLKVTSYLRQHKFDVTVTSFCDYISNEILPSIGIEKKNKIR